MNLNKLMGGRRKVQDYWKPTQTTQKQVMQWYDYVIDAGNMVGYDSCRYNYTAGVYGWNADIIRIAGGDIVVVAGYRAFGNIKAPSNLVKEYEQKASDAHYDSDTLDKLIEEFAYKVLEANGIDIEMDKKEAVIKMNGEVVPPYNGDNTYKHLKGIVQNSFRKKRGVDGVWTDKLGNEYTIELKDSRRIKDGQYVKSNEEYQKVKKDIAYEANTILDNLNGGADWYDYSYFNWFSVYEDGQPMTARVYSNNDSDWQFDVYLKNEKEEMMLNVMQNYGGFLRFNGTDYADEGRTSDAISFDTFLAIFIENLMEGTM